MPAAVAALAALGVDAGGTAVRRASATSPRVAVGGGPLPGRAGARRPPDDAARCAGRRGPTTSGSAGSTARVVAVAQDADRRRARPGCGRAGWSRPTGCTRRCAGRSGWHRPVRRRRRATGCAGTSPSRRGPTYVEVHWAERRRGLRHAGRGATWSGSPSSPAGHRHVVRRPAGRFPGPRRPGCAAPSRPPASAAPARCARWLARRARAGAAGRRRRRLRRRAHRRRAGRRTGDGAGCGCGSRGRPARDVSAGLAAVTRRYRWSSSALLAVAGRPALRRRLVPAAAALPSVFGLAVDHVA